MWKLFGFSVVPAHLFLIQNIMTLLVGPFWSFGHDSKSFGLKTCTMNIFWERKVQIRKTP